MTVLHIPATHFQIPVQRWHTFHNPVTSHTTTLKKNKKEKTFILYFLWPLCNPVWWLLIDHARIHRVWKIASFQLWKKTTPTARSYLPSDLRDQQPEILAPAQSSRVVSASDDIFLPSSFPVSVVTSQKQLQHESCVNHKSALFTPSIHKPEKPDLISACYPPCVLLFCPTPCVCLGVCEHDRH